MQIEFLPAGDFPINLTPKLKAKTVPILEIQSSEGEAPILMQESLEIIEFLDRFVGPPLFQSYEPNDKILTTVKDISMSSSALCYPRMPYLELPELQSSQGLDYFRRSREERINASFDEALRNTGKYVGTCELVLNSLNNEYQVKDLVNGMRKLTINDLVVFAELRNLTMIKELSLPNSLMSFINFMAEQADIHLYPPINKLGLGE